MSAKTGGKIVLVDGLSSDDTAKSEYHNRIEQLRDPSHVRLYSEPELAGMLEAAGLKVIHARNWDADFSFDEWVKIADPGEEIAGEVRRMIVSALSRQLTAEYGTGFSDKTLHHMIHFAEVYPDEQIVSALQRQLSWTHFKEIIYIDDQLKRDFYAEMCRVERWSTRTLHDKMQGMLYERTEISRKPAELARQELDSLRDCDLMTPDLVFRDPYLLDFLGLSDTYSERDLESAILKELERFLLELGTDFSFVARQKRITIDNEDYYLDLLFYHRGMRRLVAIELKLGKFRAADKGQMELYLRWLDKYEKREREEMPLGLILCAEKSYEHVELLRLEESGMYVAEYLTDLPPRRLLEAKLHEAIRLAREQIVVREGMK